MARRSKRRCSRGMRKGSRVCRRKPGPKKSRSSSRSRSSSDLKANYQKYIYYVKGKDLMRAPRAGQSGSKKVIKKNAVKKREKGYLYYPKPNSRGMLEVRKRVMNWNK